MMPVTRQNGIFVVSGTATVDESVLDDAVFSVRCAHHQEAGDDSGFLYPSILGRRSDNRCPYCMRIENSQRPARRYQAQRVISFRHEYGDPTVREIIEYTMREGIACTYNYGDSKTCGAPMKTRTALGPRCARHAGKNR